MMPNIPYGPMIGNSMMHNTGMMRNVGMMNRASILGTGTRSSGLSSLLGFGRGTGGTLAGARSLNLGGLLNGASKALGVVNQAIPIVKEVGPMMNNMRSMLKLASLFKDETDNNIGIKTSTNNIISTNTDTINESANIKANSTNTTSTITNTKTNDNEPNFFL